MIGCVAEPLAPLDEQVSGGNLPGPGPQSNGGVQPTDSTGHDGHQGGDVQCTQTSDDPTASVSGTEEEPGVSVDARGQVNLSCGNGKVLICHRPPGNPANEHTLCVGAPAVNAHMTHHPDSLGACNATADAGVTPIVNCANPACDSSPSCHGWSRTSAAISARMRALPSSPLARPHASLYVHDLDHVDEETAQRGTELVLVTLKPADG
jgi:hypothetical protein